MSDLEPRPAPDATDEPPGRRPGKREAAEHRARRVLGRVSVGPGTVRVAERTDAAARRHGEHLPRLQHEAGGEARNGEPTDAVGGGDGRVAAGARLRRGRERDRRDGERDALDSLHRFPPLEARRDRFAT